MLSVNIVCLTVATPPVFGPTVLPTMEEIIIGQAIDHYKEGMKVGEGMD
jgi:hypothetical protein